LPQQLDLFVAELRLGFVVAQGFFEKVVLRRALGHARLGRQHAQGRVFRIGKVGTDCFQVLQAPARIDRIHERDGLAKPAVRRIAAIDIGPQRQTGQRQHAAREKPLPARRATTGQGNGRAVKFAHGTNLAKAAVEKDRMPGPGTNTPEV
jgi:hypothetical protein